MSLQVPLKQRIQNTIHVTYEKRGTTQLKTLRSG